jgi:hypothetical protein
VQGTRHLCQEVRLPKPKEAEEEGGRRSQEVAAEGPEGSSRTAASDAAADSATHQLSNAAAVAPTASLLANACSVNGLAHGSRHAASTHSNAGKTNILFN